MSSPTIAMIFPTPCTITVPRTVTVTIPRMVTYLLPFLSLGLSPSLEVGHNGLDDHPWMVTIPVKGLSEI